MNPDKAKALKEQVEAIAVPSNVRSPESFADMPQQHHEIVRSLAQSAQNAESYKQAVTNAVDKLEHLLKVPVKEFDLKQFLQTADSLLKTRNSSRPEVSPRARISVLEGGDSVYHKQITTHEQRLVLEPLAKAQVTKQKNEALGNWTDNQASEQINEKPQEVKASTQPSLDAATSKILEAQGKIFSESVKTMLYFQGDKHPDGSRTFDSDNYHFRLDGPSGSVSVAASNGGTILAQGKVMQEASEKDIQALETINDLAQELVQSKHLAQTQTKAQNQVLSL